MPGPSLKKQNAQVIHKRRNGSSYTWFRSQIKTATIVFTHYLSLLFEPQA